MSDEWARSQAVWRAEEKPRNAFLQGLKPIQSKRFTPGLKPRPPKELNFLRKLPVFAISFVRTDFCAGWFNS